MKEALLDHQPAGDDSLAGVFLEPVDGTIRIPRNVRKKFQWMRADGITKKFFFGAEALEMRRLG